MSSEVTRDEVTRGEFERGEFERGELRVNWHSVNCPHTCDKTISCFIASAVIKYSLLDKGVI